SATPLAERCSAHRLSNRSGAPFNRMRRPSPWTWSSVAMNLFSDSKGTTANRWYLARSNSAFRPRVRSAPSVGAPIAFQWPCSLGGLRGHFGGGGRLGDLRMVTNGHNLDQCLQILVRRNRSHLIVAEDSAFRGVAYALHIVLPDFGDEMADGHFVASEGTCFV